jgi:membrane-bound ClpP family serine protease
LGYRLYSFGGIGINSGMVMIPFILGVGIVFYNSKNPVGWVLSVGALVALIFGVIASIQFKFRPMSAFDLITILVLSMGGLGLFLRSLKDFADEND